MKTSTRILAGTAILAALVVVLDYGWKYSYLKIAFPWLPFLKFDFTGIPIVLAYLLFGIAPGLITAVIASIAILARSGDFVGASMKGFAEFSTVAGMATGLLLIKRFKFVSAFTFGSISRALIMICANWALIYAGVIPISAAYKDVPLVMVLLIGAFNVIQGAISMIGGYSIFEAIRRRAPSLIERTK